MMIPAWHLLNINRNDSNISTIIIPDTGTTVGSIRAKSAVDHPPRGVGSDSHEAGAAELSPSLCMHALTVDLPRAIGAASHGAVRNPFTHHLSYTPSDQVFLGASRPFWYYCTWYWF